MTDNLDAAVREAVAKEREACAGVADDHAVELFSKLQGTRKRRSDHDIAVFESAGSEANAIAAAIRARKDLPND